MRDQHRWTAAACALALPMVLLLSATLWVTPFPLSEAVALFEDVAARPAASFLVPTSSYYRPLFHLSLWGLWHASPSLDAALAAIKLLLHIAPLVALVVLFIVQVRPRDVTDAAAATIGLAVLIGSPALLGNLELPLSYTLVAMPAALAVWILLERPATRAGTASLIALFVVAVGFKEQGLVLAPVILVAWWMGAPGVARAGAATVGGLSAAYVIFRLSTLPAGMPMFEQDIGYGFSILSPPDAEARFGANPLGIFAYNAASTVSNLLFAEPTDGMFRVLAALRDGVVQPWQWMYVSSSAALTVLVVVWGVAHLRARHGSTDWLSEARLFAACVVAIACCGMLSFNYSRQRLAGMALPFVALAVFGAVRWALRRSASASWPVRVCTTSLLIFLALSWQARSLYTLEFSRQRAVNTHREWLTDVGRRRLEFAGRPEYLRIMDAMIEQGTSPVRATRTMYPRWVQRLLGE